MYLAEELTFQYFADLKVCLKLCLNKAYYSKRILILSQNTNDELQSGDKIHWLSSTIACKGPQQHFFCKTCTLVTPPRCLR